MDKEQYEKPILLNRNLRPLFFLPWHMFIKRKIMSYKLNNVITYGIYDDDEKECLVAFYGWIKFGKKYRKEFIDSKYGYEQAIKWIEEGRRKLIEELL